MEFKIFGMYWINTLTPDNLSSAHKYIGTIEVREGGAFSGIIHDDFGPAEVAGRMHETGMSWTKTYKQGENQNGAKYPVSYNFKGVGYGWIGVISFDEKEEVDPNLVYRTSCVMIPSHSLEI